MASRRPTRGTALEEWLQREEGQDEVAKTTLNAQTWVDIRAMALIDKFLRVHGIEVARMSELLREVVRMAVTTAQLDGIRIDLDIERSIEYLASKGYSMQQYTSGRQPKRNISLAMQAQAYENRDMEKYAAGMTPGEIAERDLVDRMTRGEMQEPTFASVEGLSELEIYRRADANRRACVLGNELPYPPIDPTRVAIAKKRVEEQARLEAKAQGAGCNSVEEYQARKDLEMRKLTEAKEMAKEARESNSMEAIWQAQEKENSTHVETLEEAVARRAQEDAELKEKHRAAIEALKNND
jgi:hypothetical protein